MAIELLKAKGMEQGGLKNFLRVGTDNGMKGQQHKSRIFRLAESEGKKFLVEIKSSANMADYSRAFEYRVYSTNIVIDKPSQWIH